MFLSQTLCICSLVAASLPSLVLASSSSKSDGSCRKTKVAILGGGIAGVTAAQALSNASVSDFVIVEYLGDLGGRVAHTTFGTSPDGTPYTVELGANWVQGLQTGNGPENPIWYLAQKYNLNNTYSNYSSISTYNASGAYDYSSLLNDISTAYSTLEQNAGYLITEGLEDMSMRAAYSIAGWKPMKDPQAQAVEWWSFDWEYSYPPEQSSALFSVVNYNTTFYQYSNENNYVWDSTGFNTIIKGEASEFMNCTQDFDCSADSRLLLNTIVTNISYSDTGVTVTNSDGSCITADYAICTFSLGVLQNEVVSFDPAFPEWKETSIATFQMGTYTKIFMQFPPDQVFWDKNTQFFLYADPDTRGYFPVFQSLDGPGFLEGSGILFVTVVSTQSYTVESQDDQITKDQVLAVLRSMFGPTKVPEPIAFMYPRWSLEPWAFGSYSNWPTGTSLKQHENLRANLGRLYFAGEATSSEYYGFLQGAYFEGREAGNLIAGCLNGTNKCSNYTNYPVIHGSTAQTDYNMTNGWMVTSFQTYGF